jgi:MFS transporter, DHA2 family, multidrug resistance protein
LTIMVRAAAIMLFTPISAFLAGRGLVDPRISVALGFVLLALSNWMLAGVTTPQSDFGSLILPLVIGGIGLAQIFVPLSVAVLGGVPDKAVAATSAFFNLSRQIGGSIATAVLITVLVRGMSTHQTELAGTQTLQHTATAQYLAGQTNRGQSDGLERLANLVAGQAAVQSYADTSRWVAIITISLAPLVLLLNRPRLGVRAEG